MLEQAAAKKARYFELRKQWQLALQNEVQFLNPLKPQTLEWIT